MHKFVTENFNFITYVFEIIAAITGIIHYRICKNTTTIYFIYFLVYVVFVELFGAALIYGRDFTLIRSIRELGVELNNWYNVFWLLGSILFVIFFYHTLLKSKTNKMILKISAFLFLVFMLWHFITHPELFHTTHSPIYLVLGAILTSLCVILYFFELLQSDAILNVLRTFGFYTSVGLFVWWLIIAPVLFFDVYNTNSDWDFANLKRRIFLFANIFMYSCFTIGFLISKPNSEYV